MFIVVGVVVRTSTGGDSAIANVVVVLIMIIVMEFLFLLRCDLLLQCILPRLGMIHCYLTLDTPQRSVGGGGGARPKRQGIVVG